MNYQIKKPDELTDPETGFILSLWKVPEWSKMTPSDLKMMNPYGAILKMMIF
ncbi:hypothetical protein [Chryseobacterium sp. OSA05B]|uniref:hypothetical protein n=1 Tax=Chryseobacterium sp. OSA05B TaxID=2862650 RepID=UPI001CBD1183|nr:hypothetical protein [Chryseobacterium sp. OSA05B]